MSRWQLLRRSQLCVPQSNLTDGAGVDVTSKLRGYFTIPTTNSEECSAEWYTRWVDGLKSLSFALGMSLKVCGFKSTRETTSFGSAP